jgi:hypothetical protein
MKTLRLAILMQVLAIPMFAQDNPVSYMIAKEKNEADAKTAMTYSTAIVIAGALIGCGLFFGLRDRKK